MGLYTEIFQEVEAKLRDSLPATLMRFKVAGDYESNLLRLRYREFKNSMYELHFAKRSKNHAKYFGTGHLDLIAFYFSEGANIQKNREWLDAMIAMKNKISEMIGLPVVLGEWGDDWVWLAACLQKEPDERDVNLYAKTFSKFIEETYFPIKRAFQSLK